MAVTDKLYIIGSADDPAVQRQLKWDIRFLNLARYYASFSKDPSTQTGAAIVRPDGSVCSLGFNGFPKGMNDSPELYADRDKKYSRTVHCEMNALLLSHDETHSGYTLYTWPFSSCDRCAVHMIQAGIKRFVFPSMPPDKAARWAENMKIAQDYMREAGCEVVEVPHEVIPKVVLE
jgi:dCMP deaminase